MLPRFEVVARRRPVDIVAGSESGAPLAGAVAPYVAVEAVRTATGRAELALSSGGMSVVATYDDEVALRVTADGRTTRHLSRRHGRPPGPVEAVALTLTGPQVTALTRERGAWVVRSTFDLSERDDTPSVHDEGWLAGLRASAAGPLATVRSGRFGQLGLRDLRVVTHADGTPWRGAPGPEASGRGEVLLTATSAGPGWFPTAHASVWALDPDTLDLTHRADLYFRRRAGVYGDHAIHLLRDGGRWLVATSTWGDFHPERRPVAAALAESTADLTAGVHVLETTPLVLPTDGLRSVGVWDPHLVRQDDGWLVGFVSARRYFRFHPALAAGPDLDSLRLRAADAGRRETEGTTLLRLRGADGADGADGTGGTGGLRVLASDKRRRTYPVYDQDLREQATLDAAYPTNIPWPTLVDLGDRQLLVGFDGSRCGGPLAGYGSHGAVVVQRNVSR